MDNANRVKTVQALLDTLKGKSINDGVSALIYTAALTLAKSDVDIEDAIDDFKMIAAVAYEDADKWKTVS